MTTAPIPATALILIGGRSRRMGCNKAGLMLGGRSLLAILASRLCQRFDAIRVVGGAEVRAENVGVPARAFRWVADRWPGGGPLGGLCSGLGAAETTDAFAVACDMPLLDLEVVAALYPEGGLREDARLLRAAGRTHPLHAFYRVECLPKLEQAFAAGTRSLREALAGLSVVEMELTGALAPRAELSSWNVNTPEEFEQVRRLRAANGCGED